MSVDNVQVAILVGSSSKDWSGQPRRGRFDELLPEIKSLYDGSSKSIKLIQFRFGFSESWVYEFLYRRGLRTKRVYPKRWTEENDEKLVGLLSLYDRRTTARKLGFTEKAIRSRIRRLGLTETRCRAGWFTASEVGIILDTWLDIISDRIQRGEIKASPYNGGDNGHKYCWMITREDLRTYIMKYPRDLEGHNVDFVMLVDILVGVKS